MGRFSTPALLGQAKHYLVKAFGTNDRAALDIAVDLIQKAMVGTTPGRDDYEWCLFYLNLALRLRFERTGDLGDLDRAVTAGQEAVAARSEGRLAEPGLLSNLGSAYVNRFEAVGNLSDLDNGIDVFRKAVAAPKIKPAVRVAVMSNLAAALRQYSEWTRDADSLDEAIAIWRMALANRAARRSDRGAILANFGNALRLRSERTGDADDLGASIAAGRQAVSATRMGHAQRAVRLNDLIVALRLRSERAGSAGDLDEAITVAREAVAASPADHPTRALCLSNLGTVLRMRFERLGRMDDLDQAIAVCQEAAANELASPRVRAVAARGWGNAAAAGQRWQEAVDGFAAAIGLLGKVAPRSLARSDQEHQLDSLSGVGPDAAACCVRAGQAGRAVELFELGRGVLLGQALDARTDITALAADHEDLASQFTASLDNLDRAGRLHQDPVATRADFGDAHGQMSLNLQHRREAAEALDQVIARIRQLPGFERFLRPPTVSELSAAAVAGPIVVVNVSQFGSCALILKAHGVEEPVPLPALDPETMLERVMAFLRALDEASPAREELLDDTLRWLWDVLARPVLDRLPIAGPPAEGETWPRLWWCTSGLLSLLPLHAAGKHETRPQNVPATVCDRVVSSYTPTIRALTYARRARSAAIGAPAETAGAGGHIVAVAMPSTPGERDLPGAEAEAAGLRDRFPGQVTVLAAQGATYETVVKALPGAQWAHFACHASNDLANPSESMLLLYDYQQRPLTVPDIARLSLADAELAFLSACSTARASGRLADEAIHLASAFQLAGYRQVIGTLWPIGDRQASEIAEDIYAALAAGESVAAAVHQTTRLMGRRWFDVPSEWASLVHVGA